jgi:hypothetical protein
MVLFARPVAFVVVNFTIVVAMIFDVVVAGVGIVGRDVVAVAVAFVISVGTCGNGNVGVDIGCCYCRCCCHCCCCQIQFCVS